MNEKQQDVLIAIVAGPEGNMLFEQAVIYDEIAGSEEKVTKLMSDVAATFGWRFDLGDADGWDQL